MKTIQRGFTLIELMIVVAIIGILAAIAVPAYQDYTIRSKVSEAASLAGATRTAIDIAYSEGYNLGSIPLTRASLGLPSNAASFAGKYVESVAYDANGVITIEMRSEPSLPTAVQNGQVIYTPDTTTSGGGNLRWRVSGGNGMPAKYLPRD